MANRTKYIASSIVSANMRNQLVGTVTRKDKYALTVATGRVLVRS
jgi:hypothetical protein